MKTLLSLLKNPFAILSVLLLTAPVGGLLWARHQRLVAETTPEPVVIDPFREAVNQAMSAAELTQTAKTEAEWLNVTRQWHEAIDLMAAVPLSSQNYDIAQQKVVEYQSNLKYAERMHNR